MATCRRLKPKPRPRKHTLLCRPPLFKAGFQQKNTRGQTEIWEKKNNLKTRRESLVTKPRCRGVISPRVYFVAPKATQAPAARWCRWMLKIMPVMFAWRSYKSRNSWGATWWTFLTWDSMGYIRIYIYTLCMCIYIYIFILFFDFHTMILFYIAYIYIISVGIPLDIRLWQLLVSSRSRLCRTPDKAEVHQCGVCFLILNSRMLHISACSKGCCLNPKGWCRGTPYHPFSTPWNIYTHCNDRWYKCSTWPLNTVDLICTSSHWELDHFKGKTNAKHLLMCLTGPSGPWRRAPCSSHFLPYFPNSSQAMRCQIKWCQVTLPKMANARHVRVEAPLDARNETVWGDFSGEKATLDFC